MEKIHARQYVPIMEVRVQTKRKTEMDESYCFPQSRKPEGGKGREG